MPEEIKAYINNNDIKLVDFRFTDLLGKWRGVSLTAQEFLAWSTKKGKALEISSFLPGLDNRDRIYATPDASEISRFFDTCLAQSTLALICNLKSADGGDALDSRSIALRLEKSLKSAEWVPGPLEATFAPTLKFFIFEEVKFNVSSSNSSYFVTCPESVGSPAGELYNRGYKIKPRRGYGELSPSDASIDLRNEIVDNLQSAGLKPISHCHERANGQSVISFAPMNLVKAADNIQKAKYIIKNVAYSYGKSATFMPKPLADDTGNGASYIHSFKHNVFNDPEIADYYVGGIMHHAKALAAFTNASTNSYKRIFNHYLDNFYGDASDCAIRLSGGEGIELLFPDSTANPYLALAAIVMAGIDGVINKISPAKLIQEQRPGRFYSSFLPSSLFEALHYLEEDCQFLLRDGVFTLELIKKYIALKLDETKDCLRYPQPIEFVNYYDA